MYFIYVFVSSLYVLCIIKKNILLYYFLKTNFSIFDNKVFLENKTKENAHKHRTIFPKSRACI